MGFIALGLFILACGWKVYRDYIPTRAKANRSQGHPQYFGAALAAGFVFILAASLHNIASSSRGYTKVLDSVGRALPRSEDARVKTAALVPRIQLDTAPLLINANGANSAVEVKRGLYPIFPSGSSASQADAGRDDFLGALAIAGWAFLLALTLPYIFNIPFWANRHLRYITMVKDLEEIERVLSFAYRKGLTVAITLVNKKTYIGYSLETGQDGVSETQWIQLHPLASGYRDDLGQLNLTTAYKPVYTELSSGDQEGLGPADFKVMLPIDKILTVQHFDLDTYLSKFLGEAEEVRGPSDANRDGSGQDVDSIGPPWWCSPSSIAADVEIGETQNSDDVVAVEEAPQVAQPPFSLKLHALKFSYFLGIVGAIVGGTVSLLWLCGLLFSAIALLWLAVLPTGISHVQDLKSWESWTAGFRKAWVSLRE